MRSARSAESPSALRQIWLMFFAFVLLLSLARFVFRGSSLLAHFAVLAHAILTLYVLARGKRQGTALLSLAFLARLGFLLWDIYASHIFNLPNSGADTWMYYRNAQAIGRDITQLFVPQRGSVYSQVIGVLFYLTGTSSRVLGGYVNVLLGLSVVLLVQRMLRMTGATARVMNRVMLLVSFFPNSLIMSAIFLREIFPTFFVAASLLYFIKWFQKPGSRDMLMCLLMLAIGSMFHSGVIGLALGYFYGFLFYQHKSRRFTFLPRNLFSFVLLSAVIYLAVTVFQDSIFGKFQHLDEFEDIYQTANTRLGGSAYLVNMQINTLWQFVIFSPVKMLYFLGAPMPWNWRGPMDIITFMTDSALYLYVVVSLFRRWRQLGSAKPLARMLAAAMLGAVLIFGVGVSNAGTALRHRQKLLPLFLVLLSVLQYKTKHGAYAFSHAMKN